MSRNMLNRINEAQLNLIRWSAPKLVDDTRNQPLRPPLATITIGEMLAAKAVMQTA